MKRVPKILAIVLVAAIYIMSANMVRNTSVSREQQRDYRAGTTSFIATASINLFCYSGEKPNQLVNPVNQVVSILKVNLNKLAEDPGITNNICKREFTRYSLFSINLLIEQKITNLLYPFNFFR